MIDYFSCGSKEQSKEFMEVHFEGKSILMDDYMFLTGYGVKVKMKESSSKKGHEEEWTAPYVPYDGLSKGENLIPLESIFKTTELSILASQE